MPEYERAREPQRDPQAEAQEEFVDALEMISSQFDAMVQNFGWCAAQIVGDPDASAKIRGMMKFAISYREFGMERAQQALSADSGIRVNIATPNTAYAEKSGILVGIVEAGYSRNQEVFSGVAVMENARGQAAFVRVFIRPDGTITLPLQDQFDYPETRRLMRDLTPTRRKL